MTLATGTKLGPYEILAPIGAGGMGEVYRARDERLKRDVAVKVLPATYSADSERLRRFEQEAQAAGALNHPNITAVHDFGTSSDGSPYIVTELLEGETLRGRLAGGALPVRKATDYAIQTAKGLAAAHEKGIVHRDLKPENVFVTNDGRIKILDFGLAKLTQADGATGPQTNLPTAAGTEPGVVMGTLGYMSPEQVKGKSTDARSDIFSFGAILYEMLSGSRAFHRDTAAETMSAILREEPPDLSATNKSVQPGLERVVRHCLEKSPEERFHSAHDLAFDLESLSGTSSSAITARPAAASRFRPLPLLAGVLAAAALLGGGYFVGKSKGISEPPSFKQLTYRKGAIWGARFGSDGKTILTTAAWDGKPAEIYVSRPDSPESRPFGIPGADLAAVSSSGEVAVFLGADFDTAFTRPGTLARVSATGGAPRALLENIDYADWSPDGKELAVVRIEKGKRRIEFPPGKVLYETTGWIGNPRVSPDGRRIAFLDHGAINDDGGSVAVVDLSGKKTRISPVYGTASGLAWSPDGREVWYTAAEAGSNRILHSATLSGKTRTLARVAGSLTLQDVTRDGRVLISHDTGQIGVIARGAGADAKEVDLSWLDWSLMADISDDGRFVVFTEAGEGGGKGYSIYLRALDGSPAVRLGEGSAQSISRDGKQVLAFVGSPEAPEIAIYPTGAGEAKKLPAGGLALRAARWMPDGRHFLAVGAEKGHELRTYAFDVEGGAPRPVTPEGYRGISISLDGKRLAGRGPKGATFVYAIEGGEPKEVPGIEATWSLTGWLPDGRLLLRKGGSTELPARVYALDPETGREELWREFLPADATGLNGLIAFKSAPNGAYAYSVFRSLSILYLVEGVR